MKRTPLDRQIDHGLSEDEIIVSLAYSKYK